MEIVDDKKWSEISANIEEKIKQNKSKSKKAELDSSPENQAQSDTTATNRHSEALAEESKINSVGAEPSVYRHSDTLPMGEAGKGESGISPLQDNIDTFKLEAQHAAMQQIAELNTAKIINTEKEQKSEEEKEALIAEAHRLAGRIEAFELINKFSNVGKTLTLKRIQEEKIYEYINGCKTFVDYCKYIGLSSSKVYEDINNLNTFGVEFSNALENLNMSYRDLKQLKKQVKTGSLEVHEAEVIIDGETISLNETEQLKDALTDLILKNQEEKKQHKAELKAKDKTIQTYADAAELAKENQKKAEEKQKQAEILADKYKDDIAHFFSGRISKVAECDRSDFQDIVNLEKDFEQLNIGLSNLLAKDYSEFNANMFCCLLGKMIIAIDSARIQASSKYGLFNFDAGILSNDEKRELDNGVTPLDFLDE